MRLGGLVRLALEAIVELPQRIHVHSDPHSDPPERKCSSNGELSDHVVTFVASVPNDRNRPPKLVETAQNTLKKDENAGSEKLGGDY